MTVKRMEDQNGNTKAKRLLELLQIALSNPPLSTEIPQLEELLGVKHDDIIREYIYYDNDIYQYNNEIYETMEIRFVLYIHINRVNSFHVDRQNALSEMMQLYGGKNIIDIGFGVPGQYVRQKDTVAPEAQITLADKYLPAITFTEKLMTLKDWNPRGVSLIQADLDTLKLDLSHFDTVILFDALEHANNADVSLQYIINHTPPDSKFLVSLPICSLVPVHSIEWNSAGEIKQWLTSRGLEMIQDQTIVPNPETDMFIESLSGDFANYLGVYQKQTLT